MKRFPHGVKRKMASIGRAGGRDFRPCYGSPLAFAGTVWHRVIVNKESAGRVARDLGFDNSSIQGVARILKACGYCPSAERMAVAAMIVPDVTDEDVAEWWGKDVSWAKEVREKADYWRLAEPFDHALEYIDNGYQPGDPSPEEIAVLREGMTPMRTEPMRPVGMPQYQWNGKRGTFIQIGAE